MWSKGHLGQSVCSLNQSTHAIDASSNLVHTRTEHSTLDFDHVLIPWNDRVNADGVFIGHSEATHIKLVDIKDRVLTTRLPAYPDRTGVGIACETTCITNQGTQALASFHLIEHWSFDLSTYLSEHLVGTNNDDVIVCQAYVTTQMAATKEVVDIDCANQRSSSIHLNIT